MNITLQKGHAEPQYTDSPAESGNSVFYLIGVRVLKIAQFSAAAVFSAAAFAAAPAQAQPPVSPHGFPPDFQFPLPQSTIERWIAEDNQVAIRQRAWALWQAMTSPSGVMYPTFSGHINLPIWETWWGANELFPTNLNPGCSSETLVEMAARPRTTLRAFIDPNQFSHGRRQRVGADATTATSTNRSASGLRVFSFNKFNGDYATYVNTPVGGPTVPAKLPPFPSQTYCLRNANDLMALAYAFYAVNIALSESPPNGITVNPEIPAGPQARNPRGFPAGAISTKPVMGVVKKEGFTVLPVWQGPANSTAFYAPIPNTWKTCVVIQGNKREVPAGVPNPGTFPKGTLTYGCQTYSWGLLSELYSFQMTANEAKEFNSATNETGSNPLGTTALPGDYAVLFGMHVTTKETPQWTWQTYYWQPGETPNRYPGSKADQPDSLPSPWNNYAMCTGFSETTPANSANRTICFNPYLETSSGIPAGLSSNCMSCHSVAQVQPGPPQQNELPSWLAFTTGPGAIYPPYYTSPIQRYTDPVYFPQFTSPATFAPFLLTDYAWAVANRSLSPFPSMPTPQMSAIQAWLQQQEH